MMFSTYFKRTNNTIAIDEELRLATMTLQGRAERMLEEETTRRLRYKPMMKSTSRYYF
jgi:hypothetical protein